MVKTPTRARSGSLATASTPRLVKFGRVGDRDHGSGVGDDGSEDEVEMKGPAPMLEDEYVDEVTVFFSKPDALRPIACRLDAELGEVTPAEVLAPDELPITGNRPPVNGDTPNAYKILGQVGRLMVSTSAWGGGVMFAPMEVGGAKWVTLERELVSPIYSSSLVQLSEQTKRLLVAMGFEGTSVPSKVALEVWELAESGSAADYAAKSLRRYQIQTPDTKQVFSKTPDSPYFADSHMVTPRRTLKVDDDVDDTGHDFADPWEDLTVQIRRSYRREDEDGAQRVKLTHHISLIKLTKFSGSRNRSERSLRWLKMFIYEMEGINTPRDHWCEPFQLLMESGASNWVRQLPKKTRNKWSLLCEAFMAYYCSQHDQSAEDRYYTATRDEGGGASATTCCA
ncbi:hypothetical protein PHYSODRAFT_328675 [Phytophthora sojae]|uniref:Uncharacterized protein n=1 Tax=Phytophthora sojae (strain P6497) TaxID=1094619 RepID=G4ZAT7_PHYSP|nr:hypothetical protein PHYSODRAFT_328675 [Phytophthora sojae]EGZ20566.1 hypothetical protein PHYSODRAFT_328675 [Phytophthora sojae]|eukprot:XP_009523283.1 hypothetical protein PHYSODRAFT_328675 [Phytophthora sojae]